MQEKTDIYATSSLTDKAPGIYETLGSYEMLLPIVQTAGNTAGTASGIASAFAGLHGYRGGRVRVLYAAR